MHPGRSLVGVNSAQSQNKAVQTLSGPASASLSVQTAELSAGQSGLHVQPDMVIRSAASCWSISAAGLPSGTAQLTYTRCQTVLTLLQASPSSRAARLGQVRALQYVMGATLQGIFEYALQMALLRWRKGECGRRSPVGEGVPHRRKLPCSTLPAMEAAACWSQRTPSWQTPALACFANHAR